MVSSILCCTTATPRLARLEHYISSSLTMSAPTVRYLYPKLYMMGAEYAELGAGGEESEEKVADAVASARRYFTAGLQQCTGCIPLWRLSCRFEERHNGPNRARSIIELARLRVPKCDELWLEATRLERRAGNAKVCGGL